MTDQSAPQEGAKVEYSTGFLILLTPEQAAIVETLHDPHLKGREDGVVTAYEVRDDDYVELVTIQPDGSWTAEALNGFGYGWTRYDDEGFKLDWETGERVSDEPDETRV